MVSRAARRAEVGRALVGDASRLPFPDSTAELAVAFMSLQDMDDLATAVAEAARILRPGGRFCLAVAHPIRSAGGFDSKDPDSAFRIAGSYFERRPWPWRHSHSGMTISIPSEHRPLEAYSAALEAAGLLIESLREPAPDPEAVAGRPPLLRWTRLPCFLHIRALKPPP
jgi:SAM-dependent methyltransferase